MADGSVIFSMTNFKILIIQLRQLGDVILTTPLVRQVRKIYPEAEIHFLTENLGSQVYLHNQNINKLIILPKKMNPFKLIQTYLKIRKQKYSLVIDCFSNPKSAQFTFFSGAKERIGFEFSGRKFAYNKIIKSNHQNEYSATTKLRLIEHLGADLNDFNVELPITNELKSFAANFFIRYLSNAPSDKKIIAFNVVSRRDYKIWNTQHFVSLANKLIEKGYFLLFTFGHGEYEIAKKVYDEIENKDAALIDYPIPNITELKSLLERCLFYVGNDGGIKHLAICANIPTLTIFQNINWTNWTPPNSTKHMAMTNCLEQKVFCESCFDKTKCFINLNAENVMEKLEEHFLTVE